MLLALLPSIFYSAAATQAGESIQALSKQPMDSLNEQLLLLARYSNIINTHGSFRRLLQRRSDPAVASALRREFSRLYFIDGEPVIAGMIVFANNSILSTDLASRTDLAQIESDWFQDFRASGLDSTIYLRPGAPRQDRQIL